MKSIRIKAALLSMLVASLMACGGGSDNGAPLLWVEGHGASAVDPGVLGTQLATYALQAPLSTAESASLAFMREEEQLAHDVYAAAATRYALPVFANITASETTHASAVAALLTRYGTADPMAGLPNGTFATPDFQALYDSLAAASTVSLVEALKVGVEIEELDIRDIEAQKAGIDNADILMVYDQLLRGSRNHLRAFMKVLVQQGGSYTPKYISQTAFDTIVNSSIETGP
jgi:hypothetical protein